MNIFDNKESSNELCKCEACGKMFPRNEMLFTHDCHGIPFRLVCWNCYESIMEEQGYDGEYYSEYDEEIGWDY
ncbi:MAG: hypothetical protein LUD50_02555 [Clostridia bacterium]|nr:hypothetical protein [Clostridia bacterium]